MSEERSVITRYASFAEDLAFSTELSGEPAWAEFYQRLFPDISCSVQQTADGPLQRHGVDRILFFSNGAQLTVDEKVRRTNYDDILLELWSNLERQTLGWTMDPNKICDYIAYAIPRRSKCYFLPYPILREACRTHWRAWAELQERKCGKPFRDAKNPGYTTRNVVVTWLVLKRALNEQMHRKYSGDLVLPVLRVVPADTNTNQLTLAFMANALETPNGKE